MIETLLKRKHVVNYKSDIIPDETMKKLLFKTWQVTSSKNNLIPYSVHVLGPDKKEEKITIWNKCIENQNKTENDKNKDKKDIGWNYGHVKDNSHLIIFTTRLCDNINPYMKHQIDHGHYAHEIHESLVNNKQTTAEIEVGMFAQNLTNFCMQENIDVSFTVCYNKSVRAWQDFPFIKYTGIMLMSLGYGEKYHTDKLKEDGWDPKDHFKPEIDEIVKWA